jgi:Tol biopolymer transport system component/predicted Ser/Thr protein kinase
MSTFQVGTRLGPYQILDQIGSGGMGEVYKATDTRLERVVAIKVLPQHWATNAEMRQRFEREAQTLASLNHPHICVLHDVGKQDDADYLVMEYLEGETLATRLERGAVPLDEALKLALEIADALDKAHRKGVVHRDLKPSNVMLTKSGTKLLDFGLAKWAARGSTTTSSSTDVPTALPSGKDITTPGTILGTLQYMAPEQLEGLEADARTDIFSFGALLHEMVTGKKAFEGKSRVLLISAIATSDPPALSTIEPSASSALDHVVKVCLEKEPADRWQTARDLLAELEWVTIGGEETTPSTRVAAFSRRRLWLSRVLLGSAAVLAGVTVVWAAASFGDSQSAEELRFRVPIQLTAEAVAAGGTGANPGAASGYQGVSGAGVFTPADFAVSPDGKKLVFRARQTNAAGDVWFLYVRPVGGVTPQKLAGTEGATKPFWAADSKSIGFYSTGKLKRVDASGGPPQDICPVTSFYGGAWNNAGVVIFGSAQGLQRVSAEGGKPEALTSLADSEIGHYWPQFLPDGEHFLYTAWSTTNDKRSIQASSLGSPKQRVLVLPIGSNAGYSDPGYLVFHREDSVYAQVFDPGNLKTSGEAVRVADEITYDGGSGLGHFSVSNNRTLVYFFNSASGGGQQTGAQTDLSEWQLSWFGRNGQLLSRVGPAGAYRGVDVNPANPARVAVHRHDSNGGDIVVLEPQGSDLRLTFDAKQHNSNPIWSPDGTQIVFASLRNGKWGLYQTLSTRSGTEQMLYESDLPAAPMSWVGNHIVFWVQDPRTSGDIWMLTLDDKKAEKLIATPANEIHPQISPDGKWIAYTDNSKDERNEVYVRPFPSGAGLYQISDSGGDWPRWNGNSKEIFFHSIGANASPSVNAGAVAFGGPLYSVVINVKQTALEKEPPTQVIGFPVLNLVHSGGSYHTYAVDPRGERFLLMQYSPSTTTAANAQIGPDTFSGLTVALNWASSLKK